MTELGKAEDLPSEYLAAMSRIGVAPLWPSLRAVLPYGPPPRRTRVAHWQYAAIRPLLLQAGELTPIEKAERRVLVMCNPGYPLEHLQATASIYIGLQLIMPGEEAPNHRHSPSALRMIVEGSGGFTTVEGEKLPMEPGDLVLTPSGRWHEHGHEGAEPVIWMDALDLPLIHYLDSSYAEEQEPQNAPDAPDASQTRYTRGGLLPYDELESRAAYPMMRYPWRETRQALENLARSRGMDEAVRLAYVNPVNGTECLPILGCSAIMLRPGETLRLNRRTASAVVHVLEGSGESQIDGELVSWSEHDITAIPTCAAVELHNSSGTRPAFLFVVDDAPLQRKLKFYREFQPGEEL